MRLFTFQVDDNGCHICTGYHIGSDGYPHIKRNRRNYHVHHWLYLQTFGPIPKGKVVRHTCDNSLCINLAHMVVGSHEQNVQDRQERGRSAKGSDNGRSKLTAQDVLVIRQLLEQGEQQVKIAERFGITPRAVRAIKTGKSWGWLQTT